jgi:mono/diheme cytochrome c family protein
MRLSVRIGLEVSIILVVVIGGITVCALLKGAKADPPGMLETQSITFAKHHILVGNRSQRNPLPTDPQTLADGREAFGHYCTACHGMDGQKTGVPFADHMSPPIPSLASAEVQQYTDGQLKWILDYGLWPSGMPGSKGTLSDEELWSIVVYMRHLPPGGSLGEPEIYNH